MNSAQYMPFKAIEPIVRYHKCCSNDGTCNETLNCSHCAVYPYFSGTGFFVKFNSYKDLFFVTAKHCVISSSEQLSIDKNEEIKLDSLSIGLNPTSKQYKRVPLSDPFIMEGDMNNSEDILVIPIDKMPDEDYEILKQRALNLPHQDDVDSILKFKVDSGQRKVRAIGFPNVSKEIDLDRCQAHAHYRGIIGTIIDKTEDNKTVTVGELNWKDKNLEGFSGSPVLELGIFCNEDQEIEYVCVIGVILMGNEKFFTFLSINVVTDMIGNHIKEKYQIK